jgi:hypothetical protein
LIGPDNKLTIFFTLNGILLGKFFFKFSSKFSSQKYNKKVSRIFIHSYLIYLYIIYFIKMLKKTPIYRTTIPN